MMGMVVRGCLHGLKHLFRMYSNGEIEGRTFFMILALPTGIIIYFCVEYGPEVVLGAAMDSEVVVVKEELSEEEKAQQLEALEEERRDPQRVGEVKLLVVQRRRRLGLPTRRPNPKREFEVVRIEADGQVGALDACLREQRHRRGGRDAVTGKPYSRLELVAAWRVENATLWGKFAAERRCATR